ncbi:mate-domain-containing protein [Kickxella alabastrina]|uniref:mate-domain-containing protein n=1 Tax=Kickxella alabastrina TaxID=61397 RepID=UPI00222055FA|nr:mate-domain-containing protein [Kickxella alabastrina]KAI7833246.1 mate-domain-containing protein [Kickxella alabastrina]
MSEQHTFPDDVESGADHISGETTPLLSVSPSEVALEINKHDANQPYAAVAKTEIKWIASSSSLIILTLVLQSSFFFVNVLSVSHLGAKELAAMSLAVTCMGILAMAPSFGLLSAMDTFCSTAFTASRDKTLVGFHFQRGIIAVLTHVIIVAPIMWNAEKILLAIGQDPEISHLSGIYLRIQIPGIFPWTMFEACKRYLQAQEIMHAGITIVAVIAPIHWINSFVFVRSSTYGFGFIGAPIVTVVSNVLMFLGMLIYIRFSKVNETWGGWDIGAFRNMSAYYKLAIPAVVTICAEWVGFELLTIGISYFGAYQLAGHAITMNSVGMLFHISNGLGYGASPRIGNLIGGAKPRQARIAADMSMLASVIVGTAGTVFLSVYGEWWTTVYTDDPNIARETARLMPVACLFLIGDGLNAVFSAVLRGLGRQKVSANIFLLGFYCCAIPLGAYLGYGLHMEAVGLWWGMCIGVILSAVLQLVYIFKWIDWSDEVRLCLLRLKGSSNNRDESDSTEDNADGTSISH